MIKVGDRIPPAKLKILTSDGVKDIDLEEKLRGKKVILFAIPGAFTGTCTMIHFPSFVEHAERLKGKGIDEIICVAVNDPWVLQALGEKIDPEGKVTILSDWDAAFANAMGHTLDWGIVGLGIRSKRYSALVEDGILKHINVEDDSIACSTTRADSFIEHLG